MKNLMLVVVGLLALAAAGCSTGTSGRGAEIVNCTAGMDITAACGASMLGSCAGDPILTVCDGSIATDPLTCESSSSPGYLGRNDDSAFPSNLCPSITVTCPASGRVAVRPSAFSGIPTCNWETRLAGP